MERNLAGMTPFSRQDHKPATLSITPLPYRNLFPSPFPLFAALCPSDSKDQRRPKQQGGSLCRRAPAWRLVWGTTGCRFWQETDLVAAWGVLAFCVARPQDDSLCAASVDLSGDPLGGGFLCARPRRPSAPKRLCSARDRPSRLGPAPRGNTGTPHDGRPARPGYRLRQGWLHGRREPGAGPFFLCHPLLRTPSRRIVASKMCHSATAGLPWPRN